MKGAATVASGVSASEGTFTPIVLLAVQVGEQSTEMNMSPGTARRIGLDLIAAASAAMADAGIRRLAHRTGIDGDSIAEAIAIVVAETFEVEG